MLYSALLVLALSKKDAANWWQTTTWSADGWIFGLFAALLAAVSIQIIATLVRRWRIDHQPQQAFRQIAGHIGLTVPQCRRLENVAHTESLQTPLTLLLSAGTMSHYFTSHLGRLPQGQAAAVGRELEAIRKYLFED